MWCYRAVREIPKCTGELTDGPEITIPYTAAALESSLQNEPTQHSTDAEAAAADIEQHDAAGHSTPPEQPTPAAAAQQNSLVESSSDAYMHAVIPNLDSIIAENDFSSLDAQKRWEYVYIVWSLMISQWQMRGTIHRSNVSSLTSYIVAHDNRS